MCEVFTNLNYQSTNCVLLFFFGSREVTKKHCSDESKFLHMASRPTYVHKIA